MTTAWPFLIARGRQRGYSVLLAPHFLVAEDDYGFLEEAAGPVHGSEPVRMGLATSRRGWRFGLVWSEYRVTAADVGGTTDPRDEHSRPLRLSYGLLTTGTATNDPADLDRARRAALDTYRRFLADEHHFTTEPSTQLDAHAVEPLGATETSVSPAPSEPLSPDPAPDRRWAKALVISAAVVAGVAAVIVVAIVAGSGSDVPPSTCPDDTTTAVPTTSCASATTTKTTTTTTTPARTTAKMKE